MQISRMLGASLAVFAPFLLFTTTNIKPVSGTPIVTNETANASNASKSLVRRAHGDPLQCADANPWAVFSLDWDYDCRGRNYLPLIPKFFDFHAQDIKDARRYANYEKIMCNMGPGICAFMKDQPDGVLISGKQLKELFTLLTRWCDKSHCGSVVPWKVEGDGYTTEGYLKIDGVKETANCYGVCE